MPEGFNLNKESPGTVEPLTTGRVARKCLTKPHDLELVEHVDSFDGVKSSRIRAHSLSWMQASDTFKAISLERCVVPTRVREYLLGSNHPIMGEICL